MRRRKKSPKKRRFWVHDIKKKGKEYGEYHTETWKDVVK